MNEYAQFWNVRCFAEKATTIPHHLRKANKESSTWAITNIIAELNREEGACPHVANPQKPVFIYGRVSPDELREYEQNLYYMAHQQKEEYERGSKNGGVKKKYVREQKKTTPILLCAIASYPNPTMDYDEDVKKWEQLVVNAAYERWRGRLRSVICHLDEGHRHLHLLIDNGGKSVKPLHFGHSEAEKEERADQKGEAYRRGTEMEQDWYYHTVGKEMGWHKKSPEPRPRLGRSEAARERQKQLEIAADELIVKEYEVMVERKHLDAEWISAQNALNDEMEQINAQWEALAKAKEQLRMEREAVADQLELERRIKSYQYEEPSVFG